MTPEELGSRLAQGEGVSQEFKRCGSLPEADVFETVCSFANRQGGSIFLGVDDDGNVLGVNPRLVRDIERNIANVTCNPNAFGPAPAVETERIDTGRGVVVRVWVPAGPSVYRYRNVAYDRRADADIKVRDDAQVSLMYMRKQNLYSERRIYPYVGMEDLRADLIGRVREMIRLRDPDHPWLGLDVEHMLRAAKLYGRDRQTGEQGLTLAAVLLLGSDEVIGDVCPAYKTDALVRRRNPDRYDDRLTVATNLIDSYDRLLAFVQERLPDPFVLEDGIRVSARNIICRELVSNLLIHREYTHPLIARIVIGADGIRTQNASRALFEGRVTLDDFNPMPKNPIIAGFFTQIGRADELGSGTRNLYKYSRLYSGREPVLEDGDVFRAFVPAPGPDIGAEGASAVTRARVSTDNGSGTSAPSGGEVDVAILRMLSARDRISSSDVAAMTGVTSRTALRHLTRLSQEGRIIAEGGKRNRAYRLPGTGDGTGGRDAQ
ncbi:RNA-binding domain-containing protein [Bifidobacterium callitrichos]|uniref:Transcriptional regulator n=1 Tax=Bifidobacterium callitrichos DSM 23973 TaxID=1437609 RepID=A0A087A4Y7_9BIFI|nr:RNA-binding domain-containing protein [Bifidobacterium callitrichos]KFI53837.1 transcriptional regulator [Bifidobacterium callitrichos DSM 23973]